MPGGIKDGVIVAVLNSESLLSEACLTVCSVAREGILCPSAERRKSGEGAHVCDLSSGLYIQKLTPLPHLGYECKNATKRPRSHRSREAGGTIQEPIMPPAGRTPPPANGSPQIPGTSRGLVIGRGDLSHWRPVTHGNLRIFIHSL